jgi:hypothetical protein
MKLTSRTALIGILCFSVLARIAVALYLGDVVEAPSLLVDQRSYHNLAARLLSGHGYSFETNWYPFTPPDTPTAHWSFLYPLYLAAVYAIFGLHPLAARLVQAVLGGLLLPWLVHRLTRRAFPIGLAGSSRESIPLFAAAGTAVYFYFILYAATLMTETFYIAALLWATERALALLGKPGARCALALGAALGIATLMRQSILPWVAVLFAWLLWTGWRHGLLRRAAAALALSLAVLALAILPFSLRNYLVYGQFLLLNSNAGYAMYSAQHPMHGTDFQAYEAAPLPADLQGMNEAQMDRELMRRGIAFVLTDPARYLALSLSRVLDYFEFWPSADTSLLHNIGRVGSFGLFLPLMLIGLWLTRPRSTALLGSPASRWRDRLASPQSLLTLFLAFYALLHILTWAMARYRLPADALAMPFAAVAFRRLAASVRNHWLRLRAAQTV